MNRIYEEMFVIRPDATEEEITPIVEQVRTTVTSAGGTVDKEERWGIRKLAYRVEKRNEGYYVLMQFTAEPQTVKEVERRLRVNDAVLKYMTVRIDEKLKKIEKRRKEREKRAARKPAPVAPPPAMPGEFAIPASPLAAAPMPGAPVAEDAAENAVNNAEQNPTESTVDNAAENAAETPADNATENQE